MNDKDWIYTVVDQFYAKARFDVLIGYHFRNIPDFDEHIPRIAAFWEIQLLGSTHRKFGSPFDLLHAHRPLSIKRGELGRWLVLMNKTLDEEVTAHPEKNELRRRWDEKLNFFSQVFNRVFSDTLSV